MTHYLNLTPKRGPSVWTQRSGDDRWPTVIGAVLLAAGLGLPYAGFRKRRGRPLARASVALAAIGGALLTGALRKGVRTLTDALSRRCAEDDAIDQASADSFPASDAPQYGR